MPRVKKAVNALKRRKSVLKQAKGFRFGRSTKEREAKDALAHAGSHALAHRRDKKNDFRRLWNIQIGAALRPFAMSYSQFIGALKKKNIDLNRKMLVELAQDHSAAFAKIVEAVK